MKTLAGLLLVSSCLLPVAASATAAVQAAAPAKSNQAAHDRLFKLFKDSDEATLKRNPLNAIFRGDMRYAEHLGPATNSM